MKLKIALTATALVLAQTVSVAAGCTGSSHQKQAMSCAEGTVYDAATNSCVATTT